MSLPTLPKVEQLQAALHAKAKGSPRFRFYSLYDKVYRPDVLWQAYLQCRANRGAAGIDPGGSRKEPAGLASTLGDGHGAGDVDFAGGDGLLKTVVDKGA
ncbi:MAG: hypothetical protein ABFD16_20175, partial [Thermoguttaceae bacterium]